MNLWMRLWAALSGQNSLRRTRKASCTRGVAAAARQSSSSSSVSSQLSALQRPKAEQPEHHTAVSLQAGKHLAILVRVGPLARADLALLQLPRLDHGLLDLAVTLLHRRPHRGRAPSEKRGYLQGA